LQSEDDEDDTLSEDDLRTTDTPITPFSPGRKKFPSELKTIKCTIEGCIKTFNRPARLASHLRSHANERPFACSFEGCDKSYIEEKHLKQHVKGSHTHERSYHCDWEGCTKSFLTATRLRRHKQAHEGHDRFRCTAYPPCNQTFRKHQTLQRHIRSEHLELAPFQCTYVNPITLEACSAGFDGGGGLRRHEDRVHGILRFFCPECIIPGSLNPEGSAMHLGFTTDAQLEAHVRKQHANCPFCERRCASQRELEKHIDSQHSGTTLEQRKHILCTYPGCNRAFTKKSNLTVHNRTVHNGERYICGTFDVSTVSDLSSWNNEDSCGKSFVSKANLEDHIRTAHLGLSSLINSKRKKATFISDDENQDSSLKRKKGNTIFEQLSAFDDLTGAAYDGDDRRTLPCTIPRCRHKFMRQYDLQMHLRAKHHLPASKTNTDEPTIHQAISELEKDPQYPSGLGDGNAALENGGIYNQTSLAWELQEQAMEDGTFWIGSDAANGPLHDQWMQDELEMRRLIDAGGPTEYVRWP
jgi:general transcription factor IIIA